MKVSIDSTLDFPGGKLGFKYDSDSPEDTKIYLVDRTKQKIEVRIDPSNFEKIKDFAAWLEKMTS